MTKTTLTIHADPRTATGHTAAHLRRDGKVPAVVYGRNIPAQSLAVSASEFARIHSLAGESSLLDLVIGGGAPTKALIQDVALDPLSGQPIHVDFRAVSMTEKIRTHIALQFTGDVPAVKIGGVVVKQMDEVEVEALPQDLVHEIVVDLSVLATLEATIHIRDLKAPPGVSILNDANAMVASVTTVAVEEEPTVAAPVAAEVPVVGKEAAKVGEAVPEEGKKMEKKTDKK